MMVKTALLVVACSLMTLGAALLGAAHVQAASACNNPMTQVEMNACAEEDYKKGDQALTTAWNDLRGCLRGRKFDDRFQLVLDLQRAWIKFREAYCTDVANAAWGAPPARGSGWPVGYYGCMQTEADRWTAQLKNRVDDCQHAMPPAN